MGSLILHSLKMRKVQTASILVCVILSVALALSLGLLYGGVQRGLQLSEERSGADLMVVPSDAATYISSGELLYSGAPATIYMDKSMVDDIAAIDGVEACTAQFFSQTLDASCCSGVGEKRLIGVDFSTDFVVTPLIQSDFSGSLTDDQVLIGSAVDGATNGQITILSKVYDVVGVLAESGTDMDSSIIMDIDTARNLSRDTQGYESFWKKYGDPSGLVSCIMVKAENEDAIAKIATKLDSNKDVAYVEHSQAAISVQQQMGSVFTLLLAAAVIMLIITLLQLFARFYSCVWERKSELALYRAIGASTADLKKLIGGEVAVITGIGLVVGLILGAVVYIALLNVLSSTLTFPFATLGAPMCVLLVVGIIVVFAIIALLSILWPLRQVGRLDPSLAMQQGDID